MFMLKTFLTVVSFVAMSTAAVSAFAADTHSDKERKEDITRHRAMAKAHTDAAICLESGKKEEECDKALQAACKGLAIGKSCGMKHAH
jgi:hypothetical protein